MLADPTRATLLTELADGRALPPSELARRARVARPTVSEHLAKLLEARLVAVERGGRHRYYRLAGPEVARALEAVAVIAHPKPVRSLRQADRSDALRAARTCYGHLAGALGVALTDALQDARLMQRAGDRYHLTDAGRSRLAALGMDAPSSGKPCNDWSERRPHVAGPLGVALTSRLFELGWLERLADGRAVRATAAGARELVKEFGVIVEKERVAASRAR